MNPRDAGPILRAASALRALCLTLPHLPTPAETRQLERFASLAASPGLAGHDDVETLLAGWRQWWRDGRTADLRVMASRLAPALMQEDRRLVAYVVAAREASSSP